jgi:8-hydroxy-5-deazaflavin:NADPH oxidoreductase
VGTGGRRRGPQARVVKALNTVNATIMVRPDIVPGPHTLFVAGDDDAAKGQVVEVLESFGWPREEILDLGPTAAARGMEMYLPLWLAMMRATGGPQFNVHLVRAG